MIRKLLVAFVCLLPVLPVWGQTAPAAVEGDLPLTVGGGFSSFNLDFGAGRRMTGPTLWADWNLSGHRFVPRGLALEGEGRSIRWGLPQGFSQMKEETLLGGVRYNWEHYKNVRPYAKYLAGIGSIDFPPYPGYAHDTRTVWAPGGGVVVHAYKQVWVRGDFEYQQWKHIFGGDQLTPNGVTFGVEYHFQHHTVFK